MASSVLHRFDYKVRDRAGRLITGQLEGDSQAAVATKLTSMGYAPVSIAQVNERGLQQELRIPGLSDRVKLKDLAVFSRQFATMINSGLSLIRALSILHEQTENRTLATTIDGIRQSVETGTSLSAALAEYPKVFPALYVAMVRAGEAAGMLDEVLLRVAAMLEADVTLRAKIKSAMTYPVIVLVMAIVLSSAMLIFIVPTFAGMFDTLGSQLPTPTRMLQSLSQFVTSPLGLLVWLGTPVGLWFAYRSIAAKPKGRFALDRLKLRLPVFGPLFHKIALTRLARNLSTLLAAGVPILQALEITAETVNSGPIAQALGDVRDSVRQGESMNRPLAQHAVFPAMVVQMIAVGEETGNIDGMLGKIADFYDTEVESTTQSLTAMMEPLMIGVIGAIVGGMVIALYMPMFSIFDAIH
ncbi:type II secretion system F family protein [Egicoccus halophilus]|uniref:Type II secretion system protein F n=1 Tax=Egicoccus halophilus TaxID=1670830 RepID=A0A8J3EV46_9ACTN|nr:type II secretion system F family protein [Egicoccus halophilus]GGI07355.1 type II secretion system protein F [Egicoccus halophilus]